jgi:hypothetical protein
MLSGYHYVVTDPGGQAIGEVIWPQMAQARNARVRWHGQDGEAGAVKILCGPRTFFVEFEFLDRAWNNDTRFMLTTRGEDTPRASAELRFPRQGLGPGQVTLHSPFEGRLMRKRRWWLHRFVVEVDGQAIGCIEERRWISLVRELTIDLPPRVELPTQLFLLFLSCHLLTRQAG